MSRTHIAKDLHDLRAEIRDLEAAHKELFRSTFVDKTLSSFEGINLIVKNGQQLRELYGREKALAKLLAK